MRIVQVDLENVKSYQRASVLFTAGTNAICGRNGSGKSTVLEAIGFALFDHLATTQEQFVREGEKVATVTVHLADRDGRAYQVVRRCGSYNQYYVYDPEMDVKLVDGKGDTVDWLHEFLDVDRSGDLSALFRDAVGVPQGLLTAAFLETPSRRKDVFNPMLRVDEYENAWAVLREPARHLETLIHESETRMAGLAAAVKPLPELQRRTDALAEEIVRSEARQAELTVELADTSQRQQALEGRKDRLDALNEALVKAEGAVETLVARLADGEVAVEQAQRAAQVVEQTEDAHQAYVAAQEVLAAVQEEQAARDDLRERLRARQTDLALLQQRVEELDATLVDVAEAESLLAALAPRVEEQERLEQALAEAQRSVQRRQEQVEALQRQRLELTTLEERLAGLRQALAERAEVEDELQALREREAALTDRWGELIERREQLVAALAEAEQAAQRLTAAQETLAREEEALAALENQKAVVEAGLQERAAAEGQLAELRAEAAALAERREELVARSSGLRTERQRLAEQSAELQALETAECPLCERELTDEHCAELLARNETQIERLVVDLDRAAVEQSAVEEEQASNEAARRDWESRLADLPRPAEREDLAQRIAAQRESVAEARSVIGRLQDRDWEADERLEDERVATREVLRGIEEEQASNRQALGDLETRLGDLPRPAEVEELAQRVETRRGSVVETETVIEELAGASEDVERLTASLAALGDPRRQQQRAADRAAQRPELEGERAASAEREAGVAAQVGALEGELALYEGLDGRMERERATLAEHASAHQRYLEHIREAQTLVERETAAAAIRGELAAARSRREKVTEDRDQVAAVYDAAAHEEVVSAYTELRAEAAAINERLRERRQRLAETRAEVQRLTEAKDDLAKEQEQQTEQRALLSLLHQMRGVLRDAGPQVTRALVEVISLHAARLYAEIMADHSARLHWGEDYGIDLVSGGRERTFQQLSGGEQMAAALAVRLALLREVSGIDVAFFDEPTANLDDERRDNLARQIMEIRGFSQLFVVSHDDTFEQDTDNVVRVIKEGGASRVWVEGQVAPPAEGLVDAFDGGPLFGEE